MSTAKTKRAAGGRARARASKPELKTARQARENLRLFLDGQDVIPIGSPYVDRRTRTKQTLLRGFLVPVPIGDTDRWDERARYKALRNAAKNFVATVRSMTRKAA